MNRQQAKALVENFEQEELKVLFFNSNLPLNYEMIKAFGEGKNIQIFNRNKWVEAEYNLLNFTLPPTVYRVKPEPSIMFKVGDIEVPRGIQNFEELEKEKGEFLIVDLFHTAAYANVFYMSDEKTAYSVRNRMKECSKIVYFRRELENLMQMNMVFSVDHHAELMKDAVLKQFKGVV